MQGLFQLCCPASPKAPAVAGAGGRGQLEGVSLVWAEGEHRTLSLWESHPAGGHLVTAF